MPLHDPSNPTECALCGRLVPYHTITRIAPATGRTLCARCDVAVTTLITGRRCGWRPRTFQAQP